MSILKRAISASGSLVRVLMGAGALGLLVCGLKQRMKERARGSGPRQSASKKCDSRDS
jgi:hypothetical protein